MKLLAPAINAGLNTALPSLINTTNPARTPLTRWAVRGFTARWAYTWPQGHIAPAQADITVLSKTPAPIDFNTHLSLSGNLAGTRTGVFHGWVSSDKVTRCRGTLAGLWEHRLTLDDLAQRLSAILITPTGLDPTYVDSDLVNTWTRVNAALGGDIRGAALASALPRWVAVKNLNGETVNALTTLQQLLAAMNRSLADSQGLVAVKDSVFAQASGDIVEIPASILSEAARTYSRATVITDAAIRYDDTTETTTVNDDPGQWQFHSTNTTNLSTSTLVMDTLIHPAGPTFGGSTGTASATATATCIAALQAFGNALVTNAPTPSPVLGPVRIISPAAVAPLAIRNLVNIATTGRRRLIQITNPPPDINPLQVIQSAELVYDNTDQHRPNKLDLSLNLKPANLYGIAQ